jgi:hypothetical protein
LRAKVATEVGVQPAAVTLTLEIASVLLLFEIALPVSVTASAATSALEAKLASPAAASAFLTTSSLDVTVEEIRISPRVASSAAPTPPGAMPPPQAPPQEDALILDGDGDGTMVIVIAAVGISGLILVLLYVRWRMLKKQQAAAKLPPQQAKRVTSGRTGGPSVSFAEPSVSKGRRTRRPSLSAIAGASMRKLRQSLAFTEDDSSFSASKQRRSHLEEHSFGPSLGPQPGAAPVTRENLTRTHPNSAAQSVVLNVGLVQSGGLEGAHSNRGGRHGTLDAPISQRGLREGASVKTQIHAGVGLFCVQCRVFSVSRRYTDTE